MNTYSFQIERVAAHAGDGWHLRLLQNGVELSDRVFPVPDGDKRAAKRVYVEALHAAQAWVAALRTDSFAPEPTPATAPPLWCTPCAPCAAAH